MRKSTICGMTLMLAAFFCLAHHVSGQATTKETVITIEDLDCPTCAKKVEKAVAAVPGVASVKTDVAKMTATVTPQADKAPSARAMWEAVEKAGFQPTKLQGPGGTFTSKPTA
jgi:copper chaperone CopZ